MGTNFYILHTDIDSPKYHIGKRSAAGLYCWDCHLTLHKDGEATIHHGTGDRVDWYDKCPSCGKEYKPESLECSSAGVELGVAKHLSPHQGVTTVASFTWAMPPSHILGKSVVITDEYGNRYSNKQFRDMLSEMCPIEFYDSIGTEFC